MLAISIALERAKTVEKGCQIGCRLLSSVAFLSYASPHTGRRAALGVVSQSLATVKRRGPASRVRTDAWGSLGSDRRPNGQRDRGRPRGRLVRASERDRPLYAMAVRMAIEGRGEIAGFPVRPVVANGDCGEEAGVLIVRWQSLAEAVRSTLGLLEHDRAYPFRGPRKLPAIVLRWHVVFGELQPPAESLCWALKVLRPKYIHTHR
jgi:hypothetical protein